MEKKPVNLKEKILEGIIRKLVKEEMGKPKKSLKEETIVGRIIGYEVGLYEDGSLIIGNDSGDVVVRITNKKMAQRFATYITKAIDRMK